MTKFKETEQDTWTGESESLLAVHVNEVHIFNSKTNKGGKLYGVSVLGYDSTSMDYKPADIMIKKFPTHEAARVFAKKLIELIEE
ncbi:MAG: hypothetical protein II968_07830 [Selenomonadaceae bacterium]|nr:hypothetical protein [Selenomonadaceae bacterium]